MKDYIVFFNNAVYHCFRALDKGEYLVIIRPEFFYFLVLGKFLGKPSVGGGNKNKNKIQKKPESE